MKTVFASIMLSVVLVVASCHHDKPPRDAGPIQKAGAAVDHAAGNVKDAAKDTGHDIKKDLSK